MLDLGLGYVYVALCQWNIIISDHLCVRPCSKGDHPTLLHDFGVRIVDVNQTLLNT